MTDEMDAELTFRSRITSLDPYCVLRAPIVALHQRRSQGTVRLVGELADIDHLVVDAGSISSISSCSITGVTTWTRHLARIGQSS